MTGAHYSWFVMIMIMISPSSLSTHCIEQQFISLRSGIVPLGPHPHSPLLTPHPLPLTSGLDMPRVATFSYFCVTVCGLSREIVCLRGCFTISLGSWQPISFALTKAGLTLEMSDFELFTLRRLEEFTSENVFVNNSSAFQYFTKTFFGNCS